MMINTSSQIKTYIISLYDLSKQKIQYENKPELKIDELEFLMIIYINQFKYLQHL